MNAGSSVVEEVRAIIGTTLQLGPRAASLTLTSPLVGAIPEFDSMAVVTVITALEEHFGISVADDEISAETFATFGQLVGFVDAKLAA